MKTYRGSSEIVLFNLFWFWPPEVCARSLRVCATSAGVSLAPSPRKGAQTNGALGRDIHTVRPHAITLRRVRTHYRLNYDYYNFFFK